MGYLTDKSGPYRSLSDKHANGWYCFEYAIISALCVVLREACVFKRYAPVCVFEFAFGYLGVTTAHASWLAQVGCGILIGRDACRLLAFARETVDNTRTGASGSLQFPVITY